MKQSSKFEAGKGRRPENLSTLDDFLKQEGVFEHFQAQAIKEVADWQRTKRAKPGKGLS